MVGGVPAGGLSEIFIDVFGEIDYLGVLVAAVAYFALGGLWYSPPLFGKRWEQLSGIRPEGGAGAAYVIAFVTGFVSSLAIGFFAVLSGVADPLDGALVGLVIGVAYGLFQAISNVTFEQKPYGLVWINGGYSLVGAILAGVVIGAFA